MPDAQPTAATETTPAATPATETPPVDAKTKTNEQTTPAETPPAKPPDETDKGPVGNAWAKISKRERKLNEDAARIEKAGKELAQREAAIAEFEKAIASGKEKPWDALQDIAKRFGVDARALIRGATAAALRDKQGKPQTAAAIAPEDVERMVEERVANALKGYDEKQQKARADEVSAANARRLEVFRENIGEHLEGNAAKYGALMRMAPSDPAAPVYALIEAHWFETAKDGGKPVLLTIEEASRIVNEQIVEMARDIVRSLEPATETKPKPETDKTAGSKTTPKDGPAASTLTNEHAAEVTTRTNPSGRTSEKRAEKDRMAAAVRALDAATKK